MTHFPDFRILFIPFRAVNVNKSLRKELQTFARVLRTLMAGRQRNGWFLTKTADLDKDHSCRTSEGGPEVKIKDIYSFISFKVCESTNLVGSCGVDVCVVPLPRGWSSFI